ncbi:MULTISPECIES: VOC family protein [Halomonadaceae]|uniref:VOC family protein n=1 Tax=Halomonadaceae TaxID=28256 RepID=UPI0015995B65|nr:MULTISPECIES: VOC family protein [Halomonas]QJQ96322.1 VOC family protein [Halomonas sp. PA5]
MLKPITPHLWFDTQAREAAAFYCSLFPESRIEHVSTLRGTPSGEVDVVSFTLAGQPFQAISAGPFFTFNPSLSFIVHFVPSRDADARKRLDATWAALADGGQVLMPLDEYPFSPHYGWVQDRYGLSWQLILITQDCPSAMEPYPVLVPSLLFTGGVCGKAEEAGAFYRSVFPGSRAGEVARYPAGQASDREGTLMFSNFRLGDTWFAAMDSAFEHGFGFNEALSFVVPCRDQAEIDAYWQRLSAVPEAEQCGWCKDKYGVSWQIVPAELEEMLRDANPATLDRLTQAFLGMKKFDLAALRAARG